MEELNLRQDKEKLIESLSVQEQLIDSLDPPAVTDPSLTIFIIGSRSALNIASWWRDLRRH